jgi:xylan 1,4-beta-xylosidase
VVISAGRVVTTCSRFGRPSERISKVDSTSDERTNARISGEPDSLASTLSNSAFLVETVDAQHGFALRQWQAMGSPSSPTPDQISLLRDFAWDTHRQVVTVNKQGSLRLKLHLAPWAIALIREIE